MDVSLFIGSVGAMLILVAFFLNQIHKLSNDSFSYDFINLVGGVMLLVYAVLLSSIPFLILNSVWVIVSLKDVIVTVRKKRR